MILKLFAADSFKNIKQGHKLIYLDKGVAVLAAFLSK